jgi:hypothetical protein
MVEKQQTREKLDSSKNKENSSDYSSGKNEFRARTKRKTWSGLSDRYKNVWRLKMRDSEFKRGIVTVFTTVFVSAILSGAISSATMSYLVIPSGIILATVGAVILSSTTYDMDGFANAHIGFLLGVFICGYQMSSLVMSGGLSGSGIATSTASTLLYVIGLTVAMIGYGFVGDWLKSVTKEIR